MPDAQAQALVIVPATLTDAGEIGRLHAAAWQEAYPGILPDEYLRTFTPEKAEERIRARLGMPGNDVEYTLGYWQGKAVGFLAICQSRDADAVPGTGEIAALYLLKKYYGHGFGRRMIEYGLARLAQRGDELVTLWVAEKNKQARAFYQHCGFIEDGTVKTDEVGGKTFQVLRCRKLVRPQFDGQEREP